MQKRKLLIGLLIFTLGLLVSGGSGARADMRAYDANGEYLGVFVGNSGNTILQIYVPWIDRFVHVNINTGDIIGRDIYFEDFDCQGMPYAISEASYEIIKNGSNYFTGEKTVPVNIQGNSVLRSYNSECEILSVNRFLVPLKEGSLPVSLPVAVPLSLRVEQKYYK